MRYAPLKTRIYVAAVLAWEVFRYMGAEIRAKHFGTFGLLGYQFMLNELLAGRYTGTRRQYVGAFTLLSAIRRNDGDAVKLALGLVGEELPLTILSPKQVAAIGRAAAQYGFPAIRERADRICTLHTTMGSSAVV